MKQNVPFSGGHLLLLKWLVLAMEEKMQNPEITLGLYDLAAQYGAHQGATAADFKFVEYLTTENWIKRILPGEFTTDLDTGV